MGTSHHEFRLGLLPDHKMNWWTLVTSYSVEIFLILIVVNLGLLLPQGLELERHYHITELIAIPSPQPRRYKAKPPALHAKLLPPAPITAPRLTVPREIRALRRQPPEVEPPKVTVHTFAPAGNGDGRSNGRGSGVRSAGFGQQEVAPGAVKTQRQIETSLPTNPVEITFKPNPVYTNEARQLRLEGEVLLEVTFAANGQLQVNRVVHGLGHGLDEAATVAANKMRFKPALRNGQPVDSTAIVHVVFQLAY